MDDKMKQKPCPHCGSKDVHVILSKQRYFGSCLDCGGEDYLTEQDAIEAWNRRTDPINKQMLGALEVADEMIATGIYHEPVQQIKDAIKAAKGDQGV